MATSCPTAMPSEDDATKRDLAAINSPLDLVCKWFLHGFPNHELTVLGRREVKMRAVWGDFGLRGRGLELGFGFGTSLWWLGSQFSEVVVDAVEVSPLFEKLIPYLRTLLGERLGDIWIGDACSVPKPDATYDFINSSSFFEHLPEEAYRLAVRECFRLLKPGGVFGVWVDQSPGVQHVRVVPPDQTRRELTEAGFEAMGNRLFRRPTRRAELGITPTDVPEEPEFHYGAAWYDATWRSSLKGLSGPYLKQQVDDPEAYWQRNKECLREAGVLPDHAILDMGCGGGFSVGLLDKEFSAQNVTGIDFSKEAIDLCKRTYPWATFLEGSVAAVPLPDCSFDRVLMFDLTEHLPLKTYTSALQEAHRLLKMGGVVAILPGTADVPQHINVQPLSKVAADARKVGFSCAVRQEWVIGIRIRPA